MVDLIATSPFGDLLPRAVGGITMTAAPWSRITLVAPFRGQSEAVSTALQAALGIGFPRPGEVLQGDGARAMWSGPGQALVFAEQMPDLAGRAALTDQSDAFANVLLDGAGVVDLLARLVPVDLRPGAFPPGRTARTLVGHMTASVTRPDAESFEIMVMRSMAATLVHELVTAAENLAARRALKDDAPPA